MCCSVCHCLKTENPQFPPPSVFLHPFTSLRAFANYNQHLVVISIISSSFGGRRAPRASHAFHLRRGSFGIAPCTGSAPSSRRTLFLRQMDCALSAASRVKRCHGKSGAILNIRTLASVEFAAFKGRRPPVLVMATPLALTPASGAPTPTSANASGPLASLLASA